MTQLMDSMALATHLGVPKRTLDQWAYRKIGPRYIKVGRYRRYRSEDVAAWLDSQTVTTSVSIR